MRTLVLTLFCSLIFCPSFAQEDSLKQLVRQGVQLHDKGDYEGAIRIYDQVIGLDNNYYLAYNEKSMSLYYAGKYEDCIDLCKTILKKFKNNPDNGNVYVSYGSSLDGLGKPDEAINIYKEGTEKYPNSSFLFFNKAITEYHQQLLDDATADVKKAISLRPGHASSHQILAYCVYSNNKLAAVLSLATFLLLEPEGKRAQNNLKLMLQLLSANVEKRGDKGITITVSPNMLDTTARGDDDFHSSELVIGMRSALDNDDHFKNLPPAENFRAKLELLAGQTSSKQGFFTRFYIPFFRDMKAADLMETACYVMFASSDDEATKNWLEDHKDKIEELSKWIAAYQWAKD